MNSAATVIKNWLNFTISDGRVKLPAYYEPTQADVKNCLMIFLTGADNPPIAIGRYARASLHSREVEIGSKHSDKSIAEDVSFKALELLGTKRQVSGISIFLNQSPIYKGMDYDGSHVYSFKLKMRGNK